MERKRTILIEGIDRLGKSTLVSSLATSGYIDKVWSNLDYITTEHLTKPSINNLDVAAFGSEKLAKEFRQKESYIKFFKTIDKDFVLYESDSVTIYDRAHLGEYVYSPMYRGYYGSYVFDMEKQIDTSNVYLILLYTDDFSFLEDDGESFNFHRKDEEQTRFESAFDFSNIKNKIKIKINDGNNYRSRDEILNEVLTFLKGV